MEVYFKNISSEETPTERLVEDVMMLVNETEDFVNLTSATLAENAPEELKSALERLKERCQQIKEQALAGARHTDRYIRKHPYQVVGVAFGLGILIGVLAGRKSKG
jgi:ElaB/YqjD/DUF883 family membrane-anchored ribosome-binding protein